MIRTIVFLILSTISIGSWSASKQEIDNFSTDALNEFYSINPAGKRLAQKAKAILVFPKVYKAGFGIGGEYGEGKLISGGQTLGYYSIAAASFGLQFGAQKKSQVILFMTSKALEDFRNSKGWEAGVDGSVAIADMGAGEEFDTKTINKPIIGFIFSNKGLMANLTIEGAKITEIVR